MLQIRNITKSFDGHKVFQDLNFTFAPGCYALSEQESSGKSTLLAIIAGELSPDSGQVVVGGDSPADENMAARLQLAYIPDDCLRRPEQTGMSLLQEIATTKNTGLGHECLDLAERLGLAPHLEKRFEQMSTGTRRKVYLAAAAIGNPRIIIADGPTNGLDTQARLALAEQFNHWAKEKVVLFASFDMPFVQACNAVEICLL